MLHAENITWAEIIQRRNLIDEALIALVAGESRLTVLERLYDLAQAQAEAKACDDILKKLEEVN